MTKNIGAVSVNSLLAAALNVSESLNCSQTTTVITSDPLTVVSGHTDGYGFSFSLKKCVCVCVCVCWSQERKERERAMQEAKIVTMVTQAQPP